MLKKAIALSVLAALIEKQGRRESFLSPYKGFLGSVTDPLILPEV